MSKNRSITDFFKSNTEGRSKHNASNTSPDSSFVQRPSPKSPSYQDAPPAISGTFRLPPLEAYDMKPKYKDTVKEESDLSNPYSGLSKSSGTMPKREPSPSSPMNSIPPSQELPSQHHRQAVKGGKAFVKSSDDEDSDLESLEDIDDLLAGGKKQPVEVKKEQSPALKSRLRSADFFKYGRRTHDHSPIVIPKYKFSLDSLVKQTEEDQITEAKVASAKAAMDTAFASKRVGAAIARHPGGLDENLLFSVVSEGGDEGQVERVLHAMGRTGALNREAVWYFFDSEEYSEPRQPHPFPEAKLPDRWQGILKDPISRQQAFLSGFARDMAALCGLPDEVMLWLQDEICLETRDDLRLSYVMTLHACSDKYSAVVDPGDINGSLSILGATEDALDMSHSATPFPRRTAAPVPDFSRLHSLIDVYHGLSKSLSLQLREHLLCVLARLTLDSSIAYDYNILSKISDTIAILINDVAQDEEDRILSRVGKTIVGYVRDPSLRFQLLDAIPNSSPRVNLFRRRLAFAFFYEDSSYLAKSRGDILQIPDVIKRLDTASYSINRGTDYVRLAALISILNIGIDRGVSATALSSKELERTFNADVDALAAKIKSIFSSIVDAGATHMTRTIAKEILERLHYRLIYSVRTRPKPKKSIFGPTIEDDQGSGAGQANFMSRFLQLKGTETPQTD